MKKTLFLLMALFAGSLSAAELKLACFNHFTSYFKDFKCPADEIVSIRKMPQAEIIRQLAAGQLSMAITIARFSGFSSLRFFFAPGGVKPHFPQ